MAFVEICIDFYPIKPFFLSNQNSGLKLPLNEFSRAKRFVGVPIPGASRINVVESDKGSNNFCCNDEVAHPWL